eukprot:CAMPEP_0176500984 /NCGR_PEP_ID=MMETSP0200_2-20121128/13894_1 /TAXON_ID=947934 /ORGANISM="Chaetoceros sp., Strain GSL56" /LENGTH=145 /DNA_ID=CAMNT_0017899791 /DNA_START=95 /DNA_END=532 /DNA_ORIENTATION=-
MSSTTESFVASIPDPVPMSSNTPASQRQQQELPQQIQKSEPNDLPTATSSEKNPEILQLPPADPNSDIPKLQFGQAMKLDVLGPIIINTDGTTRRIDNWDTLTEQEKEVTWRRIRKRNAERREMLEAKYKELSQQEQVEDVATEE